MFYFVQETIEFLRSFLYFSIIWAFPKGRAIRYNLFSLKEREKRISTTIPNANIFVTQFILFSKQAKLQQSAKIGD